MSFSLRRHIGKHQAASVSDACGTFGGDNMSMDECYEAYLDLFKKETARAKRVAKKDKLFVAQKEEAEQKLGLSILESGLLAGDWEVIDHDYEYRYELGWNRTSPAKILKMLNRVFYGKGCIICFEDDNAVELSISNRFSSRPKLRLSPVYPTTIPVFLDILEKFGITHSLVSLRRTLKRLISKQKQIQEIIDKWTLEKVEKLE